MQKELKCKTMLLGNWFSTQLNAIKGDAESHYCIFLNAEWKLYFDIRHWCVKCWWWHGLTRQCSAYKLVDSSVSAAMCRQQRTSVYSYSLSEGNIQSICFLCWPLPFPALSLSSAMLPRWRGIGADLMERVTHPGFGCRRNRLLLLHGLTR